jgi:hypothetical protein
MGIHDAGVSGVNPQGMRMGTVHLSGNIASEAARIKTFYRSDSMASGDECIPYGW